MLKGVEVLRVITTSPRIPLKELTAQPDPLRDARRGSAHLSRTQFWSFGPMHKPCFVPLSLVRLLNLKSRLLFFFLYEAF